jgi:uncharacterized protein YbjT (DUF2867 family)
MDKTMREQRVLNLLVLGATGRTGSEVVNRARAIGHRVRAFVHDPAKASVTNPDVPVIAGDVLVPADLRSALAGQDAVISTIGSHRVTDALISNATETLIEAMDACGVRRVVTMSNFAVSPNYRPSKFGRLLHPMAKTAATDMATGEALLRGSDLDWTIVRASRLVTGPGIGARVVGPDETVTRGSTVTRAAVAEFMLGVLDDASAFRRVLTITGR